MAVHIASGVSAVQFAPLLLAVAAATAVTPAAAEVGESVMPSAKGPKIAVKSFKAIEYESPKGGKLLYRLLTPVAAEPGRKYPLVLYLHGAGGRGSDNTRQLTDADFCPKLLNKANFLGRYPCYLIAPQVPHRKRWVEVHWGLREHTMPADPNEHMRMALEVVDAALSQYPVDPNRVYVTGPSMGGFGTWDAIQRRPGFFAAAIPVCGGGDAAQAPKLAKMPIWVWHGDSDRSVPTSRSRDMVAAIRAAGGKPLYTEAPNCGHRVWPQVYGSAQVWDWLFAQRLGKPEVKPTGDLPKVTTRTGDPRPAEK